MVLSRASRLVVGGPERRSASNAAEGVVHLVSGSTDEHRLFPSRRLQTLALSLLPEPGQLCLGMLQPGFHPQLYLARTVRNRSSMESWGISSSQRGSSNFGGDVLPRPPVGEVGEVLTADCDDDAPGKAQA